jgi:hypothetical protein
MMKTRKKRIAAAAIAVLTAFSGLTFAGCGGGAVPGAEYYTVSFETGAGGSAVPPQRVRNGKRVVRPDDPTNAADDAFVRWMYGDAAWNFETGAVTRDITLAARWRAFTLLPVEAEMSADAFSGTLTWWQGEVDEGVLTEVYIKPEAGGGYSELSGTRTVEGGGRMELVSFTPAVKPQGGYYNVKIATLRNGGADRVETEITAGGGAQLPSYLRARARRLIPI